MSSNSISILISAILTALVALICAWLVFGPLSPEGLLASVFLFLPVYATLFALFYLLLNRLLPVRKKSNSTKKNPKTESVTPDIITYRLENLYIFIGLLTLATCAADVFRANFRQVSVIFLIFLLLYIFRRPYRIDTLKDDSLVMYGLFWKKHLKISDIQSVCKGIFSDGIKVGGDDYYFSHLIPNITRLTNHITQKIGQSSAVESSSIGKRMEPDGLALVIRLAVLILFGLVSSIIGVMGVKDILRHLSFF